MTRQRLGRCAGAAAERRREARRRPSRASARSGAGARFRADRRCSRSDRAGRRRAPGLARWRRRSDRPARGPTRPKPSSTTSVRGAAGGAAAADLRQLERGVDAARRLGGLLRCHGERDVPLGRALRDRDDVDAARRERREHARRDAWRAGHAVADDGNDGHARPRGHVVDQAARQFVAERRAQAGDGALGFAPRAG